MNRRKFHQVALPSVFTLPFAWPVCAGWNTEKTIAAQLDRIADPMIRKGVEMAIVKTLEPAATETAYPGHFNVTADGKAFGGDKTWPGLDCWQMAGAYLLLDRDRMVLDYFDEGLRLIGGSAMHAHVRFDHPLKFVASVERFDPVRDIRVDLVVALIGQKHDDLAVLAG